VFVGLIQFVGSTPVHALHRVFHDLARKYSWVKAVPVAIAVNLALFLLFEVWFKVPLPKGPIEAAFRAALTGRAHTGRSPEQERPAQEPPEAGKEKPVEEISSLLHGFSVALTPFNLLLMFVGVVLAS